ncbi:MAG: DUF2075 domain-containing protein [Solobacterium sp.]|nr:DUF2075 domain-containing protein [Solobacterium sp.]
MIIYNGIKTDFLSLVMDQKIEDVLSSTIYQKMHRHTPKSELDSWKNSMMYMFMVLSEPEIPSDAGIAIEYNIPQSSKRVDFIVSGYGKNDEEKAVIIELKQWEKVTAIDGLDGLVETYTGGALRQVVHPSYQAWSYARLIQDYNESVQNESIDLIPCAYLHNYETQEGDPLFESQYTEYIKDAPVFTRHDVQELQSFIHKHVSKGDNSEIIYKIDKGKIKPSKSLQDAITSMVQGNQEFVMIDDQKVVYEKILDYSRKSYEDGKKRVVIIKGGPGTGKTVVAINLLAKLTEDGQFTQYASKNSAPRNVYQKKLKGALRKSSIDNMFKGSGAYTDVQKNMIDTLIVDEAHRLNEKSGLYGNLGENQIKEIIHSAKCSVFFIDENQRVTLNDIGSVAEIKRWAFQEKAEVYEDELVSQFRCNGSDGYLAWVDNMLEIRETANTTLEGIDYSFQVFDDPADMHNYIIEKNREANKARVLAGYCWEWPTSGKNNPEYHDIVIGDYQKSWNLSGTQTWAIDPDSVDQIGCIHTSQGLEFDYVGVIIGPDLRYENGHIVTDYTKRAKSDQSLRGIGKMVKNNPERAEKLADEIIKNTYRTLLTRGMKGCAVYCCDKKLSEYISWMVSEKE